MLMRCPWRERPRRGVPGGERPRSCRRGCLGAGARGCLGAVGGGALGRRCPRREEVSPEGAASGRRCPRRERPRRGGAPEGSGLGKEVSERPRRGGVPGGSGLGEEWPKPIEAAFTSRSVGTKFRSRSAGTKFRSRVVWVLVGGGFGCVDSPRAMSYRLGLNPLAVRHYHE